MVCCCWCGIDQWHKSALQYKRLQQRTISKTSLITDTEDVSVKFMVEKVLLAIHKALTILGLDNEFL